MRNKIIEICVIFKSMPILIKLFSTIGIFGIFFALGSIQPFVKWEVQGIEMSLRDFWAQGYGLQVFLMGTVLFISGVGMYLRRKGSRVIFLCAFLIGAFPANYSLEKNIIIVLTLNFLFLVWYLYFQKSPVRYFYDK